MLVGGVIVSDEVDVEALRRLALDLLQEAQPFDMHVARFCAQLFFAIIERREQRRRSLFSSQHNTSARSGGSTKAIQIQPARL